MTQCQDRGCDREATRRRSWRADDGSLPIELDVCDEHTDGPIDPRIMQSPDDDRS